ncbi:MAG: carboxynorspermidine decarboxylase [Bacteroidales bacterium]|nr:carboxynorspermidine decarboxylase [Bacteroidales bacterium]
MNIDLKQIPSPCYVLEERLLRKNLELINKVQKEAGVKIILALKGFAMFSTFKIVKQYLETCTASSLNEAKLCNQEMKGKAHLYSPVYLENEFDELLKLSSHITFNSLSQWDKFKNKVLANTQKISCGLRINPEYSEVKTDLYNPCIAGSRLGIRAENLGNKLTDGIEGLHFHSLCENNSYTLENTLKSVEEKFSHLLKQAKWLNMGGGHLMTHKEYNVQHLIDLLKDFKNKYPNLEIILEPGGAVGWQTGYLVSTVQDIIESKGIKVAMLDVSFSAHMPDCLEMPYKPMIHGATDAIEGKPTYRMGGVTCLAGDHLGDYSFEKPLKPGDKIVFDDMIHYTMVKTTTFNGVTHPSIGIWTEGNKFKLVRKFGYEDYRNRLS